jgi:hypothetical protein
MIIYSVTVSIENELANEWLEWMQASHIPAVMATGYFKGYTLQQVLEPVVDPDRINYNVLYEVDSHADLEAYKQKDAPALQREHQQRYGENALAIRVVMHRLARG